METFYKLIGMFAIVVYVIFIAIATYSLFYDAELVTPLTTGLAKIMLGTAFAGTVISLRYAFIIRRNRL